MNNKQMKKELCSAAVAILCGLGILNQTKAVNSVAGNAPTTSPDSSKKDSLCNYGKKDKRQEEGKLFFYFAKVLWTMDLQDALTRYMSLSANLDKLKTPQDRKIFLFELQKHISNELQKHVSSNELSLRISQMRIKKLLAFNRQITTIIQHRLEDFKKSWEKDVDVLNKELSNDEQAGYFDLELQKALTPALYIDNNKINYL